MFIDTAHGPVVDEGALAEALKAGEIAAAGLDVYEEEPIVHEGLLGCENTLLLPHAGGATRETQTKMAGMAAGNIVAVLEGRRPPNCVNPGVLWKAKTARSAQDRLT